MNEDEVVELAKKHGAYAGPCYDVCLESDDLLLDVEQLTAILADHEQQVIKRLAEADGAMPQPNDQKAYIIEQLRNIADHIETGGDTVLHVSIVVEHGALDERAQIGFTVPPNIEYDVLIRIEMQK